MFSRNSSGAAEFSRISSRSCTQRNRFRSGAGDFGRIVEPVRGDAVFRDLVHVRGADLEFDLLVARLAQCHAGMQALVEFDFGVEI